MTSVGLLFMTREFIYLPIIGTNLQLMTSETSLPFITIGTLLLFMTTSGTSLPLMTSKTSLLFITSGTSLLFITTSGDQFTIYYQFTIN